MSRVLFAREGGELKLEVKGKADISVVEEACGILLNEVQDGDSVALISGQWDSADTAFVQLLCSAYKGLARRGVRFQLADELLERAGWFGLDRCSHCLPLGQRMPGALCPVFGRGK